MVCKVSLNISGTLTNTNPKYEGNKKDPDHAPHKQYMARIIFIFSLVPMPVSLNRSETGIFEVLRGL